MGLEPTIFWFEVKRVIHYATRPCLYVHPDKPPYLPNPTQAQIPQNAPKPLKFLSITHLDTSFKLSEFGLFPGTPWPLKMHWNIVTN